MYTSLIAQVSPEALTEFINTTINVLTGFGFKIIGAILLWFVGRRLIKFGAGIVGNAIKSNRRVDATFVNYIKAAIVITLEVILIVAILGFFGVETASFAALLAGAGVAIGAAWSGMLANFAAGVFLVFFRPFNVGDFISAGGVIGTVQEIGLFVTTIDTMDNVRTIIANNKIFADNIQNFSTNPYRRVELVAQLNHGVDHAEAISLLKARLSQIDNVFPDPSPDVEILEFNLAGPVLAVRPYCNNQHYWQVYFDTNRVIRETCGEAGYPVPEQHYTIRQA